MLIELKSKQGFEKNPFKSNLDPIFRCQYHLYMPIFLWKWNPKSVENLEVLGMESENFWIFGSFRNGILFFFVGEVGPVGRV